MARGRWGLGTAGLPIVLTLVALAGCGGGGSSGNVTAQSLEPRLIPASSLPGFTKAHTYDWSDPINLVGEGIPLPAATHPSDGVQVFKKAGLRGAAG